MFLALIAAMFLGIVFLPSDTAECISCSYSIGNKVTTKKQLDEIFSTLKTTSLRNLGNDYREKSGLNKKRYRHVRKFKTYFLIPKEMLSYKILRNNTFSSIVSDNIEVNGKIPLLIDKRVLYKYIEMCDILEKKGYNPDNIKVTAGHRNPAFNDQAQGAYKSQHLVGKALDFDVGDINMNGVANMEDKEIVYEILNKKILKSKGGIGKYSWDPHGLHIDVRSGRPSRWVSFSRK